MNKTYFLVVTSLVLSFSCGGQESGEIQETLSTVDTIVTMPLPPLETALQFSNLLGMNDPECFYLLVPFLRDSVITLEISPQQIFGRWRGFDAGGRLTEISRDSSGIFTSYYCSIVRMDNPPIVRIDFSLVDGVWLISGFGEELPREVSDSLTIEHLAELVLEDPAIRMEMRLARFLIDDNRIDSLRVYSSWEAVREEGIEFPEYIVSLSDGHYRDLTYSNIRRSAKLQIIQDRATYRLTGVSLDLNALTAGWREMSYLWKAVLRARHESMQNLRINGIWQEPDITEEIERLQMLRNYFMAVSDIVELRDTLSRTYPVLLTAGSQEPLREMVIELDPHMVEQRSENDLGITVWRALGVEMNGDNDPERVVYWSGDIFLFQGTSTGYRLVWRTYDDYDSDYHAEFMSEPSSVVSRRIVVLIGNEKTFEYQLGYEEDKPVFRRIPLLENNEGF